MNDSMKITCQSCQAKYTIADEKIIGKVVKIRCKKCGATIVVNGSDATGPAASIGAGDTGSSADAAPLAEGWTVNVAEGDQRTLTQDEVVAAFHAGTIDDETYCWRDGMADWLPLGEIETLREACRAGRRGAEGPQAARPPRLAGSNHRAAEDAGFANRRDVEADLPPGPAPNTARRAAGRAPSADIFGTAAQAGGDEDVMTSVPARLPQPHELQEHEDPQKLTGARNENSVLFSLQAVTGKPVKEATRTPAFSSPDSEASGLIDIRQLSAQLSSSHEPKKKSRVDDIMNLSGGGAFTPALTAPVLSAPHPDSFGSGRGAGGASVAPGKSPTPILVALGIGAVVILAAVGGTLQMMRKAAEPTDTARPDKAATSASNDAVPSAGGAASGAAPANAPSATAPPGPTPAASAGGAPATPAQEATPPSNPATEVKQKATAAPPRDTPGRDTPTSGSRAAAPAAAAESDQPFNMGEAKARLGAAADTVQSCKKGDTIGTGHVIITFAPSGSVQSAVVDGAPFEGTPTGACVASRFRSVHVPAFGGSPFKVRKSFTIN